MRLQTLNVNHVLSYFISRLTVGLLRKLRFVKVIKTNIIMQLLYILYKSGIIRTYRVNYDHIAVYFKYQMVSL